MKRFLVSRNEDKRLEYIKSIKGKKIAIYKYETPLIKEFDLAIQMDALTKNDVCLEGLSKMDGDTSVVLIDVLVKNGVYVHPYGKIYAFTEQAKQVNIIDSFAFKYTEKGIFRPFLFIDPEILGHSLSEFYNEGPFKDFAENTLEMYYTKIAPHIILDVKPIEIQVIKYQPEQNEIQQYESLKKELIADLKNTKPKIVSQLIKYVDSLPSKKRAYAEAEGNCVLVSSNSPKNKFWLYDTLRNENISRVCFLSSGIFGADEIELHKTKFALERHNELIRLING